MVVTALCLLGEVLLTLYLPCCSIGFPLLSKASTSD